MTRGQGPSLLPGTGSPLPPNSRNAKTGVRLWGQGPSELMPGHKPGHTGRVRVTRENGTRMPLVCFESLGGEVHLYLPESLKGLPGFMLHASPQGFLFSAGPRTLKKVHFHMNLPEHTGRPWLVPISLCLNITIACGMDADPSAHGDEKQPDGHVLHRPVLGVCSSASELRCNLAWDRGVSKGVPGDPTRATWSITVAPDPALSWEVATHRAPWPQSRACLQRAVWPASSHGAQLALSGKEGGGRHGKAAWDAIMGEGSSLRAAGATGNGGPHMHGARVSVPGRGNGVPGPGVQCAQRGAAGTGGHRCGEGRGGTRGTGPCERFKTSSFDAMRVLCNKIK